MPPFAIVVVTSASASASTSSAPAKVRSRVDIRHLLVSAFDALVLSFSWLVAFEWARSTGQIDGRPVLVDGGPGAGGLELKSSEIVSASSLMGRNRRRELAWRLNLTIVPMGVLRVVESCGLPSARELQL